MTVLWPLVFAMGVSVGSFLNVVADRLPQGQSLVRPRSFCPSCNTTLAFIDLVPIISYLWLRGKCRYCGTGIPLRLLLVELVNGLLFTLIGVRYGLELEALVLALSASLLLLLAIIDLERGLVLNSLLLPAAVALLVVAPFWSELGLSRSFLGSHSMLASFLNSLLAGAGAFLLFLAVVLALPQGMGWGDVKLAWVLGLLVGFPAVLAALWLAVVSGGLVGILLLLLRRRGRKDAIPFVPFLALGSMVALFLNSQVVSWYGNLADKIGGL